MDKKLSTAGKIIGSAVKGAAVGGGVLSTPFKAAYTAGKGAMGVKKGLYNYKKRTEGKKTRFKKKLV